MADKKDMIEPINASFEEVLSAVAPKATAVHAIPEETVIHDIEFVEYTDPGNHDALSLALDPGTETIWATQAQMAELFGTKQPNISTHLKNIFDDGELEAGSNIKKINSAGSTKPVTVYSLDTVISVGYRVNSKAATRFRQWATQTLKAYIEEGYVLNDRALRESPEKLNRLAAELRALRSEEKQIYAKVRECFKISASDYQPSSEVVPPFRTGLQRF